jgi:hypothetical protein
MSRVVTHLIMGDPPRDLEDRRRAAAMRPPSEGPRKELNDRPRGRGKTVRRDL